MWYDNSTSTYRKWVPPDEPNENVTCVRYTKDGFKDRACSTKFYYTCKKNSGSPSVYFVFSVTK